MTASKMPEAVAWMNAEDADRLGTSSDWQCSGDKRAPDDLTLYAESDVRALVAENEALRNRYELIKQAVYGEDNGIYVELPLGRAALMFEMWNHWPDIDGFDAAIDAAIDQARCAE